MMRVQNSWSQKNKPKWDWDWRNSGNYSIGSSGGGIAPNGNPSNLVLTVDSDTAITCNWTNGATNQTGTRVYISTDGVSFTEKGTALGALNTFQATGLTEGTLYYFYVASYEGNQEGTISNIASATTWLSTAIALFAEMASLSEEPTYSRKVIINKFQVGLIAKGLNTKPDSYGFLAAHGALSARICWVKNETKIVPNNPNTFSVDRGYMGSTSGDYMMTGFSPSTDGIKYSDTSRCVAIYNLSTLVNQRATVGQSAGGGTIALYTRNNMPTSPDVTEPEMGFGFNIAVQTIIHLLNSDASGFYAMSGTTGNNINGYRNKTKTHSDQALGARGSELYMDSQNQQVAFWWFSSFLNDTEINNLNDLVDDYLTDIGAKPKVENILVLGNSITLHGIVSYWWGLWGMAASIRENDFVHQLENKLQIRNSECFVDGKNIAVWEADHVNYDKTNFDSYFTSNPELVILRLGENVASLVGFGTSLQALVDYIYVQVPNAKIVITGSFMSSTPDALLRACCVTNNLTYIELNSLFTAPNKINLGDTVYDSNGDPHTVIAPVPGHPNDAGMLAIATKIYNDL